MNLLKNIFTLFKTEVPNLSGSTDRQRLRCVAVVAGGGDGFAHTNGAPHACPLLVQAGSQWARDQYQSMDRGFGDFCFKTLQLKFCMIKAITYIQICESNIAF